MNFQTVLFDLDGTLVDSRADLAAAVNHSLKAAGQPLQTEDRIIPHVGNGLRMLLSGVMGPVSPDVFETAVKAFSDFYEDHCVDQTVLYGGVKENLEALARVAKLGVITNKPKGFADKILKELGVDTCFSSVMGGDSLPERKPHPAPVLKSVEVMGGNLKATLMVGDGFQDIKAGQAAGTRTCLARYGYGVTDEVWALKPDYSIQFFKDIKEIVI